jgi:hypothetical protein
VDPPVAPRLVLPCQAQYHRPDLTAHRRPAGAATACAGYREVTHPSGRFHRCTCLCPSPVLAGSTRTASDGCRFHTCYPVYRGLARTAATVRSVHPLPVPVRLTSRVHGRRARHPGIIQRPGDPRSAVPGQPLAEHPRHDRPWPRPARAGAPAGRTRHAPYSDAARHQRAGTRTAGARPDTGPAPGSAPPSRSAPGPVSG